MLLGRVGTRHISVWNLVGRNGAAAIWRFFAGTFIVYTCWNLSAGSTCWWRSAARTLIIPPFLGLSFSFSNSGPSVFSNVAKGNFSHRIPTPSRLETVTSDKGLRPSSWVPAYPHFFPLTPIFLFQQPTWWTLSSSIRCKNNSLRDCLTNSNNCVMSNPCKQITVHTNICACQYPSSSASLTELWLIRFLFITE